MSDNLYATSAASASDSKSELSPAAAGPSGVRQGPKLVYVVENDRISSAITELIVKKNLLGGEVRCYADGHLAFAELSLAIKAGATLPDLIVLDLDMPLMDGWGFLDAVAGLALPHPMRVFVLTSSLYSEDQEKALSYKAVQGFFTKPLKVAGVTLMQDMLQVDWTGLAN
ncbi:MAG: response regulator [Janthinobacterium lividum]